MFIARDRSFFGVPIIVILVTGKRAQRFRVGVLFTKIEIVSYLIPLMT